MDLDGGEESKPRESEKKSNPNPKGESKERKKGQTKSWNVCSKKSWKKRKEG